MDNPDVKKLFELIEKGTNEAVVAHVKASKVKIDCLDPKGMTPLQLVAFRGNPELCEFFLANGADVNSNKHDDSYTALMFAALSGQPSVVRIMLEAGANIHTQNKVNRTAGQMAAFVGQHQCVSVINNFFPQSEINYFTKPHGLEKEAKLPAHVAPALCTLINLSNIHPVRVSVFLREHLALCTEAKSVCAVLGALVERNMKARDINDIMAIKCHFLQTIVKMASEAKAKDKDNSLNGWLKLLCRGREGDGCMELQERLIRQALKDFPFSQCALLQQLVRQIAPVKIGDDPPAFQVLTCAINGQQFGWDAGDGCTTCWEAGAKMKCSKCTMVKYCNQDCQRLNWPTHKKFCAKLAAECKAAEEQRLKDEEEQKNINEDTKRKLALEEEKMRKKDIDMSEVQKGLAGEFSGMKVAGVTG